MARHFSCPCGHCWEATADEALSTIDLRLTCPVCGGVGSSTAPTDLKPRTVPAAALRPESGQAARAPDGSPLPAKPAPRTIPGDGFEILEELGRGSMGVLYKARQVRLKRVVALKMILAGDYAGPQELRRFCLEAEALANLQHPNIVQIHEVGERDGRPYLALEFVDGGTLADRLRRQPVRAEEAALLVETLARTIHYAHQRGVIHRDLKPSNVLLTRAGVPKITDFGLAKQVTGALGASTSAGLTQSNAIVGTPSYMAPEQAAGKSRRVGPAADIYALGAILYELLTDRPPFEAETPFDIVLQVVSREPVRPARLNPEVPRDLEIICLKCLQKEPGQRYASALDLAEDLRRFQDYQPIRARPLGQGARLWRWCRRNPVVASLMGVVLLAAVGLVGLFLQLRLTEDLLQEESKQPPPPPSVRRPDDRPLLTLTGHSGDVAAIAFCPGRPWLASAGQDGSVRVWDLTTGRARHTLDDHTGPVHGVAFSPDGRYLASAGEDRTVKVWDAVSGEKVHDFAWHHAGVWSVAFSPEGRYLASAGADRTLILWDRHRRAERVLGEHSEGIRGLAFSRDGKRLAVACATITIWEVATGKELRALGGHTGPVNGVAFSPDGQFLASAGDDRTVRVWDTAGGKSRVFSAHHYPVHSVTFSPDGRQIASGNGRTLRPARMRTVVVKRRKPGPARTRTGLVNIWNARDGKVIFYVPDLEPVLSVACSPDGRYFACAGAGRAVIVWKASSLDLTANPPPPNPSAPRGVRRPS